MLRFILIVFWGLSVQMAYGIHVFGSNDVADTLTVYLYDDADSANLDKEENIRYNKKGQVTHITQVSRPRMLVYKPKNPSGHTVLMCPGGGYSTLNVDNPRVMAEQLMKYGLTVFVLVYRLPVQQSVPVTELFEGLQDARKGLQVMKEKAKEWGYPNGKSVLWGSSAGAHLAAMVATDMDYQNQDGFFKERADYLVLTFPVTDANSLSSSKRLFGYNPTQEVIRQFSPYQLVSEHTPETFLVHASNDQTIPPQNSIQFYEALYRSKVSTEMHIYSKGGHGFGYRMSDENSWMNLVVNWLSQRGLVENKNSNS